MKVDRKLKIWINWPHLLVTNFMQIWLLVNSVSSPPPTVKYHRINSHNDPFYVKTYCFQSLMLLMWAAYRAPHYMLAFYAYHSSSARALTKLHPVFCCKNVYIKAKLVMTFSSLLHTMLMLSNLFFASRFNSISRWEQKIIFS